IFDPQRATELQTRLQLLVLDDLFGTTANQIEGGLNVGHGFLCAVGRCARKVAFRDVKVKDQSIVRSSRNVSQPRATIDIDGACKGPLCYAASTRNAIVSETNPPPQHANRIASQDPPRRPALTPEFKRSLRNQTWTFIRNVAAAPR